MVSFCTSLLDVECRGVLLPGFHPALRRGERGQERRQQCDDDVFHDVLFLMVVLFRFVFLVAGPLRCPPPVRSPVGRQASLDANIRIIFHIVAFFMHYLALFVKIIPYICNVAALCARRMSYWY